jgi:hypothetical protein
MDYLNAVVTGNHRDFSTYRRKTDEGKLAWIQGKVTKYRRAAQDAIVPPRGFSDGDHQGEQFDKFRAFIRTEQDAAKVAIREARFQ